MNSESSNEDFKTAKVCEIEQEDEMMNHHKQKSDIERHKKSCSDYHFKSEMKLLSSFTQKAGYSWSCENYM